MKKIYGFIALAIAFASCERENSRLNENEVVFNYSLVESHSLTKTMIGDDVKGIFEESLPSSLSLNLVDEKGNSYTISTGTPSTLPCGKYNVTAYYNPNGTSVVGNSVKFVKSPKLNVNTTVTITYDKSNYEIPASIECFAIVVDLREVGGATFEARGNSGTVPFMSKGTTGLIFCTGDLVDYSMTIQLASNIDGYANSRFTFQTIYKNGQVFAENGKYYVLHPREITSVDSGMLSLCVGGLEEGFVPETE